jgi:hypothetical protein
VASIPTGLLGASAMAWSPDGRTFTYVANGTTYAPEWHLVTAGLDRVLTTFPTVRPRGTSPDASDIYLSFSGDGKYVALVENWVAGVSNDQANVQVRDGAGRLLYARHDATMPTWSSQYLYLWDTGTGAPLLGTWAASARGRRPRTVDPAKHVAGWKLHRIHLAARWRCAPRAPLRHYAICGPAAIASRPDRSHLPQGRSCLVRRREPLPRRM